MGGLDDEIMEEEKVVSIEEKKPKRRPFHYWKVGDREYKLKLTTRMIEKVEDKYGKNLLMLVSDLPPLSVMLTIVHAAMIPWEHGVKYSDIQAQYDKWTEAGGSQMEFYTSVIMPLLEVSGFFTASQAESMTAAMQEIDEMM